jgi:signal transduction histidine kinase
MSTVAPVALGTFSGLLVAGGFALGGVELANLHNGLLGLTFTAVGVFVLVKRPGHREGRLFVATGVAHAVMFFGRQYGFAAADGTELPAAEWVQWIGVWPLALVLVLVGVTFMCFPDGRLPTRRWRAVVVAMASGGGLVSVASAVWPVEYADNSLTLSHPLDVGGYDAAQDVWNVAGPACYLLIQVAWVACVVVRLRRAEGDEARQLRWFAYSVAMGAVLMLLGVALFRSPVLGVFAAVAVPIAAGVAIVKYRLYDIDLVISRTLVVGAMAGIIAAGYAVVVVGVGNLLGVDADGSNPLLPLVAMAMIAIVFEPARRRVRVWADRLVYGDRPTPYEALSRLSSQLSQGGQDADLFRALASTVAEGVGAAEVTLWVGDADDLVPVESWPPRDGQDSPSAPRSLVSLRAEGRTHVRPIEHQGSIRGAVSLTKQPGEALTGSDDRLLADLVAQAGLVIDHVGLGAELQRRLRQISVQAAELRAAARRIVAAEDAARMRIERDLHDGAQQRLVTLALSLRILAERATTAGAADVATQAEAARGQLTEALAELRDLARGIHPAILTQDGLEAAVCFLGERAPLPVRVDLRLDRRLRDDVEATAYFVVSEALTNAAKHAHATSVAVSGCLRDGQLRIEVTDDGRGGADGRRGSGLQGLADRLATLDGRLTVLSPAGGGTRVEAVIPCE